MSEKYCTIIEGGKRCIRPNQGRGLCSVHYGNLRRHGHPRSGLLKQCPVIEDGKVCLKKSKNHGMCQNHYYRWKMYGDPLYQETPKRKFKMSDDEFKVWFFGSAKKTPSGCWLWTKGTGQMGYGKVSFLGETEYTHRVAWILTHEDIPDSQQVNHHCDTPRCINPEHLYLGTQAENSADMVRRHRNAGKGKGVRKLSNEDVLDIKNRLSAGEHPKSIAEDYPVHVASIHNIKKRKTWANKIGRTYLNKSDAVKIKRMLAQRIKQQDIADSFGVSVPTISAINTGKIWRHVN